MLLAADGGPLDARPEAFYHVVERRRPQHLLNVRGLPEGTRWSRSVLQRGAVCSTKPAAKEQVWSRPVFQHAFCKVGAPPARVTLAQSLQSKMPQGCRCPATCEQRAAETGRSKAWYVAAPSCWRQVKQ